MRILLLFAATLHLFFMIAELFPWACPLVLRLSSKKLPPEESLTPLQERFAATIVHNAGIYNGIVAAGLLSAYSLGSPATALATVMFAGATVAGIFGTATLKSPLTALQAVLGALGLYLGLT